MFLSPVVPSLPPISATYKLLLTYKVICKVYSSPSLHSPVPCRKQLAFGIQLLCDRTAKVRVSQALNTCIKQIGQINKKRYFRSADKSAEGTKIASTPLC